MTCPACQRDLPESSEVLYCPYCGYYLPTDYSLPGVEAAGETIGRYQVVRPIARGGMGEVFLTYDPASRRRVALKRILPDLQKKEILRKRFLREAWVNGQLAHPGVIPVYEICAEGDELYYTMPFVEGDNLKGLLKRAKEDGDAPDVQIPSLVRIFMSVCQTMAYAHSRGILHRDLKPDNIMVGKYGEVLILDWGLAKWERDLPGEEGAEVEAELTQPGKIFGTLAYLDPEVALGNPTSTRSDIYALGAMLYQILALRPPFSRPSLAEFRKGVNQESWVSPAHVAPYRNVPKILSRIARRCLRCKSDERYSSVDELIHDLQNYMEGRSEWFAIAELDPKKPEHWSLHENLHLSPHLALTQTLEGIEWVSVMLSKDTFPGNVALRGRVRLRKGSSGIGLLLAESVEKGLCLWLGSKTKPGAILFRHQLEVLDHPDIALDEERWYTIRIEKIANHANVYLEDRRIFSYTSYLPLPGTRVGLLYRDTGFELADMQVFVGSYSIRVNCLAIPDAFLAERLYDKAIVEYRRIAASFPERNEGREALFRAGVAQLERGSFERALDAFSRLHDTPSAPLELLGKALVYEAMEDPEEEAKCFELALRRYADHPRLPEVQEHLVYRLQQSSTRDRTAAYRLAFIAAFFEPLWQSSRVQAVIDSLESHWEPLPFLTEAKERESLVIHLCFWLARPLDLQEMLPNPEAERALQELREETLPPHPIWTLLEKEDFEGAEEKFSEHSLEEIGSAQNILHFLYGCYLAATEGEEIAQVHFSGVLETPYPRSWTLFSHYITGREVEKRAFLWERRQLYRQQILYYSLLGRSEEAEAAQLLESKCYVEVESP